MCVCGLCSLKQRNFGRATCGGCRCAKDDGRERGGIIEGLQQLASFASFAESPLSLALSCWRPESPSQPLFRGGGGQVQVEVEAGGVFLSLSLSREHRASCVGGPTPFSRARAQLSANRKEGGRA